MRSTARLVALAVVVLATAVLPSGCAKLFDREPPDGPWLGQPSRILPSSASSLPGTDLIGLWRVSDASGVDPDTWIRFGDDLALYQPCGWSMGEWRTSDHTFIASISGWNGACGPATPAIPWLTGAVAFSSTSMYGDVELLDANGDVIARLAYDGAPPHDPSASDDYRSVPAFDDRVLARIAPLPPAQLDRDAVTSADLLGRWVPSDADPRLGSTPYVEFAADGTWAGSDGANGIGGRWSFPDGRPFLVTGGPTTLIGSVYDLSQVGDWLASACAVDSDHGVLVLLDSDGTELGRLTRG